MEMREGCRGRRGLHLGLQEDRRCRKQESVVAQLTRPDRLLRRCVLRGGIGG